MVRLARAEVFDPAEVAIAHVINRTVRRCFLFGDDPVSGKNFDHRKIWIEDYLNHFAANFGIDLLCFSILSNHFHLILRSRPDVVACWDDREVARRWLMICPIRKDANQRPEEPAEPEINSIVSDADRLAEIRSRLSNISWWMRLLSQRIAQRANKEDKETGRFFQDRYRAVRLLDEASLLACAAYVDLNPIRAAMAETLEDSDHTSVQRRIESAQGESTALAKPDRFLAPVFIGEVNDATGAVPSESGRRCSDKGFLCFSLDDYLQLLDWTARRSLKGKRGRTPRAIAPVLQRLGLRSSIWDELVANFGKLFINVAGQPSQIETHRAHNSHRRFHATAAARELLTAG